MAFILCQWFFYSNSECKLEDEFPDDEVITDVMFEHLNNYLKDLNK